MSSFIIYCVEQTISPININANSSELDNTIRELILENQKIQSELNTLLSSLAELSNKHADKVKDANLQNQIINYLERTEKANEFVISSDLDSDPIIIYHELCNLLKEGKVVQIIEKGGIKWKIKE